MTRAVVLLACALVVGSCGADSEAGARVLDSTTMTTVAPQTTASTTVAPQTTLPTTTTEPATTTTAPPSPIRHVSPNSPDGGDGSVDNPYNSLATALKSLIAGQTLIVHEGTYTEQIDLRELGAGTDDEPIEVRAADGERPVVVGLLWLADLENWRISGINVTWDEERNTNHQHMVKLDGGRNWAFTDAEIWGARSFAAILVSGLPEAFQLSGLYVHDTMRSNDTNQDHLIYLNSGTHGGIVERNLLVGSPNGRAIKVGPESPDGDWVGNVMIRYNTMIDNLGPSNVQLGWRTTGVVVENNLMAGALDDRANVTTFELTGGDNVVRNNVGWGSVAVLEDDVNLEDGGGNVLADPMFTDDGNYRPTNPDVDGVGYLANP